MKRSFHWTVCIAAALLIGGGLARLKFDVDVLNLLPGNHPVVDGIKLFQRNFTKSRELIIALKSDAPSELEAAAAALAVELEHASNLVLRVVWQPPWQEHPAEMAELLAYLWLNQSQAEFTKFAGHLKPGASGAALAETKSQLATGLSPARLGRLSYDPYGFSELPSMNGPENPFGGDGAELFASEDGTFRLLFVEASSDLGDYKKCEVWLRDIKYIIQRWQTDGNFSRVATAFTGQPEFAAEIAQGMESDTKRSVAGTLTLVAILFWAAHRRWRPLIVLMGLLTGVLLATLAVGGLLFGSLNVVSIGFAAILLSLAVDYGLILYQERCDHREMSSTEIRRRVAPGIIWSAASTAGAFFTLQFCGLPGLGQMGGLVAVGITTAAGVLLWYYLPLTGAGQIAGGLEKPVKPASDSGRGGRGSVLLTVGILFVAIVLLWWNGVRIDHSGTPLRPKKSAAYDTLDELGKRIGRSRDPIWLLHTGENESDIASRLTASRESLKALQTSGKIGSFVLPDQMWPRPDNQTANKETARGLISQWDRLKAEAMAAGFTQTSLRFGDGIMAAWRRALDQDGVFWPSNSGSQWILDNYAARANGKLVALGLIYPAAGQTAEESYASLLPIFPAGNGIWLCSWELLGRAVWEVVRDDLWRVCIPAAGLLLLSLWFAFRAGREILLCLGTLLFSFLGLLGLMAALGWSWNLMNLAALPLLFGAGVDYGIHVQLALRRLKGDVAALRLGTGRALWLCGGTTIAGFGSLAWSSNAGMASLGQVCAAGIAITLLTSLYLLPEWWRLFVGRARPGAEDNSREGLKPARLYSVRLWKLGLHVAKSLPSGLLRALAIVAGNVFWALSFRRREVIRQNLLPVFPDDPNQIPTITRKLYRQFALKLVDLWQNEAGLSLSGKLLRINGWEYFLAAQACKKGVLLVTIHLGNWEYGAPLLAERGFPLNVVTVAEPGRGFTEFRRQARSRFGVGTFVIGEDPFSFVQIIRALEAGESVALLVDRPTPGSLPNIELFGHPFAASGAVAELARASGAAIIPTYVVQVDGKYLIETLPAVDYNRAGLRDQAERHHLTQRIMRAFEPAIRHYPDQWFQFVPVWPHHKSPADGGLGQ